MQPLHLCQMFDCFAPIQNQQCSAGHAQYVTRFVVEPLPYADQVLVGWVLRELDATTGIVYAGRSIGAATGMRYLETPGEILSYAEACAEHDSADAQTLRNGAAMLRELGVQPRPIADVLNARQAWPTAPASS